MTLRCALYARYPSDQQRAASIEDQFRVCRERAERECWKIAGAYKDSAISGDSMILRPGIQALLEDARRGLFEIVVAEALDRVSRDQADVATLYKHLCFAGVTIVTLSEGEINELHVGPKGTMNALFLKDLAAKTHRGLRGRVEKGKSGGGLCYGYDVVKAVDGTGDPIPGGRTIDEAYAEETNRLNRERRASGAADRRELAGVEKKIATMIAVIEDGGYVRGMMDRLRELEARQDELRERQWTPCHGQTPLLRHRDRAPSGAEVPQRGALYGLPKGQQVIEKKGCDRTTSR